MASERRGGVVTIDVIGTPAPKGSNRAIKRGGLAVLVPGSSDAGKKRMLSWARAVRTAALDACAVPLTGKPVEVSITFWMPRPKSVRRGLPMVKPDIDKLARCTLDALTGVAFDDDSRICYLKLSKHYANDGQGAARIEVIELAEDGTRLI